ncbi:hypothetical protein CGZ80_15690 [Rhodopirellula sp. MGV]|nr:hypothetical protein CGZ80_15690 [Rhodopirellula sp. MGV]PNY35066.1 DUF4465 domain-containing protein [Rhodopirellula baltica]
MTCTGVASAENLVDFESFSLGAEGYFNGPTANAVAEERQYWWGTQTEQVGTFDVQGVDFSNSSAPFSWGGFAVSNHTDNFTPSFANQYSAFPGGGAGGSSQYAVAFGYRDTQTTAFIGEDMLLDPTDVSQLQLLPSIYLPEGAIATSIEVANTTYAALTMQDGDAFTEAFGGLSGSDLDYLTLSIFGVNASNQVLAESIEFNLADYRFANDEDDYILDTWAQIDLTSLAGARSLHFNLASSDIGDGGMNTPSYFAIDNLAITAIPEPSSFVLLSGVGLIGCTLRRRRGTQRSNLSA